VIVQEEHLPFENEQLVWQLRGTAPWREIAAGNARAAQVFRIERSSLSEPRSFRDAS
jgi:hypothetical protein